MFINSNSPKVEHSTGVFLCCKPGDNLFSNVLELTFRCRINKFTVHIMTYFVGTTVSQQRNLSLKSSRSEIDSYVLTNEFRPHKYITIKNKI